MVEKTDEKVVLTFFLHFRLNFLLNEKKKREVEKVLKK